ncbi:MAG: RluA family pseudouridine synthase [Bacilli bacterium]|nr:RluA family pseudouridine synthase [Bacilli bacterium]
MKIIISEKEANNRLDIFLSTYLKESRNLISKNIKSGDILVNKNKVKAGYLLKINDEITYENLKDETLVEAEELDLEILYEDNDIIVVNKPSGMVVHPGNGNKKGTLVNGLMAHTKNLSNSSGNDRCGIVHRIDKDTSGVLLVAKNNKSHKILSDGFKNKTIKRKYIALVHGIIDTNKGKIVAPIGRSKIDRKKMCVTDENSKSAITYFTVLERFNNSSLVELELETGRTHQIRVHMKYINHPVVNDSVYSNKKVINDYGQLLHAAYLGFNHPITNEFLEFETPLPKEFIETMEKFKNL